MVWRKKQPKNQRMLRLKNRKRLAKRRPVLKKLLRKDQRRKTEQGMKSNGISKSPSVTFSCYQSACNKNPIANVVVGRTYF